MTHVLFKDLFTVLLWNLSFFYFKFPKFSINVFIANNIDIINKLNKIQ